MFFESMHAGWQALLAGQEPLLASIEQRILTQVETGEDIAPQFSMVIL